MCYCPNPIISITGYCTNCTYLFGPQCVSCSSNQSACSNCSSGYLISPLNGSCYCPRRVANNTCLTCKAIYGPECLVCNALACTNCSNGYFIDNTTGSCFCPTPVVNGVCLSCSYLYGTECIACNTTNCTGCAHQMLLIRNNCSCPVGHFITVLGVCETCIAFYSNCL